MFLAIGLAPRLGCAALRNVSGAQYLGSGYTKAVYRVRLPGGAAVALKAVDFSGHDLGSCVREFGARRGCYRLAAHKLLKEMVLLERLRHPNVLQVRGCGCGAEGAVWTCLGPVPCFYT